MSSDSGGIMFFVLKSVCQYIFKVLRECEEQSRSKFLLLKIYNYLIASHRDLLVKAKKIEDGSIRHLNQKRETKSYAYKYQELYFQVLYNLYKYTIYKVCFPTL